MGKWVIEGELEYDRSLLALELGNVTWKPGPRCEQEVGRLFPNRPLAQLRVLLARSALEAMRQKKRLKRFPYPGSDDQFGIKFKVGRRTVLIHWFLADEDADQPQIEVTSFHEDGQ